MFDLFLMTHIGGALMMALSALGTLISLLRRTEDRYAMWARVLAFLFFFELVTGSLLAFLGEESGTRASFCGNIALYLSISLTIQGFLYIRMREKFPVKTFFVSLSSGACAAALALVFAF